MRAVELLLAAAFVAVGGFALTSTLTTAPETAQAATCNSVAYHPTDQSWACDYDVDGHRVRAHIDTSFGPDEVDRISAWAPSQGCSQPEGVAYGGGHILRIRICTEGEGRSGWKRVS